LERKKIRIRRKKRGFKGERRRGRKKRKEPEKTR